MKNCCWNQTSDNTWLEIDWWPWWYCVKVLEGDSWPRFIKFRFQHPGKPRKCQLCEVPFNYESQKNERQKKWKMWLVGSSPPISVSPAFMVNSVSFQLILLRRFSNLPPDLGSPGLSRALPGLAHEASLLLIQHTKDLRAAGFMVMTWVDIPKAADIKIPLQTDHWNTAKCGKWQYLWIGLRENLQETIDFPIHMWVFL